MGTEDAASFLYLFLPQSLLLVCPALRDLVQIYFPCVSTVHAPLAVRSVGSTSSFSSFFSTYGHQWKMSAHGALYRRISYHISVLNRRKCGRSMWKKIKAWFGRLLRGIFPARKEGWKCWGIGWRSSVFIKLLFRQRLFFQFIDPRCFGDN